MGEFDRGRAVRIIASEPVSAYKLLEGRDSFVARVGDEELQAELGDDLLEESMIVTLADGSRKLIMAPIL